MKEKKTIIELTTTTIEEYRERRKRPLSLLADNVRSRHNIGSFFRTSDAFLVEEIILCGISATPPDNEIAKTALGAEESVKWRYADDSLEEVKRLKGKGKKICVLEQAHDSVMLREFMPEDGEDYVLVVGNEVEGVNQKIVNLADVIIEIPQNGIKHSLNVSVSAGIALWELSSKMK
ncbi:MAG: RNA methyltransferase [Muribaculaceae bacterium]|nr:RNA methyltransferase [Muribaculaceae bacterium]